MKVLNRIVTFQGFLFFQTILIYGFYRFHLLQKLYRRKTAADKLSNVGQLDEQQARRIREKLCIDLMSGEETDEEDTPKKLIKTRFVWESVYLKNLKKKLDQVHYNGLTQLQRQSRLPIEGGGRLEDTPVPPGLPNSWVNPQYR